MKTRVAFVAHRMPASPGVGEGELDGLELGVTDGLTDGVDEGVDDGLELGV